MPGFTSKKSFRIIVWTTSVLLVILVVAYFIIVANAESMVERLVAYETKGKFKVTVEKIRLHPFQRRIDLINISLQSDHVGEDEMSFEFTGDRVSLQLSHIRPLIFRKQLLVDSILFESPRVKILQGIVRKGWGTSSTKKITLHEALGDVYVKMQNLFKVLYVKRGEINNGELIIADNADPQRPTVALAGIDFLLERLDVNQKNHNQEDAFMFSENITFHTGHESIDLPDGLHHISFSQLTLNTQQRFIELDSCFIHGVNKNNPENKFDIFNRKLKIVNLDFAALYSKNIIRADSVYCSDPDLKLKLGHTSKTSGVLKKDKYNYDSLQQIFKMIAGNLSVHYLGFINANINTFYSINNKINNFSTAHASFEIYDLNVNSVSNRPATVSRVDFALRNYKGYTPDSMYIIKFDSIRLLSNKFVLWNASLFPGKKYAPQNYKDLHVDKFELTNANWVDFLEHKRITADRALLEGANVKIYTEKRNKVKVQGSLVEAIHSINPSLNVKDLLITNATIEYEVKDRLSVKFQHASAEVSVQEFIRADSIEHMQRSLKQFSADKGSLKTEQMTAILSGISFSPANAAWAIQKMEMRHGKGIDIKAENVFVEGFKKSGDGIFLNGLGWKKATVNVRPVAAGNKKQDDAKKSLQLAIGQVAFTNTAFSFEKDDKKINTYLNYINGRSISSKKEIELQDLHISGNNISFETTNEKLNTGAFEVQQNASSWFREFNFTQSGPQANMSLQIPELHFKPDINQLLQKKYVIRDIVVQEPSVRYTRESSKEHTGISEKTVGLPLIDINALILIKPSAVMDDRGDKKTHLDLRGNEVTIKNIKSNSGRLEAGEITAGFNYLQFINDAGIKVESHNGKIEANIDAAHFNMEKDSSQSRWQVLMSHLSLSNIQYEKTKNDSLSTRVSIHSFGMNDFLAREKSLKSFEQMVRDNPHAYIQNATARINRPSTNVYFRNLQYKHRNMVLDSLSVMPVLDQKAFNATSIYQKDYIKVNTGKIMARGIDLLRYASEKKLVVESVSINEPVLEDHRDMTMVFKTGIIKPLPAQAVSKITLPVFIDTVNISGGFVSYTETSEKTKKTGTISFNKLNAWIHPLKNFDFQSTDSLRLRAEALMQDNMFVNLRVRESYTDTLAGFLMTVAIKPADLPILNPVLEPLASVQVGSGRLDHLEMRAVGREYVSFGEMKFYYHDLKVKILKDGELEKKTFLTNLATFVANNFVIRTNNTKRGGRVFYVRNRERSIFNYWIKMTLTGVASSAGARSNSKMLKKYKQEIKKKQLPPINLD